MPSRTPPSSPKDSIGQRKRGRDGRLYTPAKKPSGQWRWEYAGGGMQQALQNMSPEEERRLYRMYTSEEKVTDSAAKKRVKRAAKRALDIRFPSPKNPVQKPQQNRIPKIP